MIFYFTGTGNSRWVAEALGTAFDEPLVSIADALNEGKNAYPLGEREKVFFVFPVHSWGPAVLVPRFISRLILSGYKGQEVYFVCTCGDDCGYTDRIMRSILARRGIAVTGGFSVQMPNNYVLMPGFDVDSKEVETEKLKKAPERLKSIISFIKEQKTNFTSDGSLPKEDFVTASYFYGGHSCAACYACLHWCPKNATLLKVPFLKHRPQYHHPDVTLAEIKE